MEHSRFQVWKNPSYLQSSFGIFMFFCSWGIWWSFFQRWLNTIGLNGAEVGQIYSINSLATLIIMFAYGAIQDQLGIKRHLAIAISAIAALVGPFVHFIYAPMIQAGGSVRFIGALLGSVVLSAGFMAGCSLIEALTERYSRKFDFEFGQSRAWGSFGYAIVALVAGHIFNINPMINFWVGSAFGLAMLAIYAFWVPSQQKEALSGNQDNEAAPSNPSIKDMLSVLTMPTLWLLIVFMLLTNTFYTVFDQQMFPTYYTNLFPTEEIGNSTYSTLNGIQVFMESAMMGVVPIIMRKIGVRNALLCGAFIMFARIGLCGIFHDPISISIVKMFHSIEVPLFVLPTFRYFTLHFDTKLSATLYMVGFQVASQVGQVIFSTPLGALHDALGDRTTFLTISAIVLAALIYGFFILKKDNQEVGGDPFYTDKQLKAMQTA
ncbi:MFS transporter [Alloscardovia omnicolens]|uniref:MFS transporter n=1 Tax=Alloscardovia omnicolens TaxID=419015 RepID=UPI00242B96D8|nr:MFS transporter [Alloscardovia omnicolens]MBS6346063.1 MFS transporter [Alloscardovia omnicolens]MDK6521727.1 MFS transporter [Alloscardovia omnicolens]MDK6662891.1 MFS transporter [Alloscardovia omnicolens]MDK7747620.1 MFS transporter [Alloscardovia omnicolens]MDU6533327.1 MFS transporter [Alloscardovia omnicolens]